MTITSPPDTGVPPRGPWSAARVRSTLRSRAFWTITASLVVGIAATLAALSAGLPLPISVIPLGLVALGLLAWLALAQFEWFVLGLLVVRAGIDSLPSLGGVEATQVVALGFMGVALLWLAAQVRANGLAHPPTTVPSLLLLGAAALSLLPLQNPTAAMEELLRLASGLLMLEVLLRITTTGVMLRRVVAAVALSALVPVAVGLHQSVTGGGALIGDFRRTVGTFHHPNPYSIYLVLVLLMIVSVLPYARPWERVLLLLVAAPTAVTVVLTYTRSAWLALFVGVAVIGWLQARWLIGALLVSLLVAVVAVPGVAQRFSDLGETTQASGDVNNSLIWRLDYWQETASLAEGRLVTGVGLGMVRELTEEAKSPHNDAVRMAAETGVLGLLAYLTFLGSLVLLAWRALRARISDCRRGAAVGYTGILTATLLLSLASNVITQVVLLWYVAAAAALAAPALLAPVREPGETQPPAPPWPAWTSRLPGPRALIARWSR